LLGDDGHVDVEGERRMSPERATHEDARHHGGHGRRSDPDFGFFPRALRERFVRKMCP
jgi:hypothetical protein